LEVKVNSSAQFTDIPEYINVDVQTRGEENFPKRFRVHICWFISSVPRLYPNSESQVNILMAGLTGATKSSFGNSIFTALHQSTTDIKSPLVSGGSESHVTVKLIRINIPDTCINLWDMWGFSKHSPLNMDTMKHIINGRLPSCFSMNGTLSENLLEKGANTSHTRRIHAVLFFIPQLLLNDTNEEANLKVVIEVWSNLKQCPDVPGELPMFLMVTKVDEVSNIVRKNPESDQDKLATLLSKAREQFDVVDRRILYNVNYMDERTKSHPIDRLNSNILLKVAREAKAYKISTEAFLQTNEMCYLL